jgi:hypothetical protein
MTEMGRLLVGTVLAVAIAGAGCRTGGGASHLASPSFTAPEQTRDRLLARLTLPSLARTFATVDGLRARNALPFGSDELAEMVAARLGIPADVLKVVETGKPLGLAFVVPPGPPPAAGSGPRPPLLVAGACELKLAEAAAALATVLGPPVASQKDAQQFRRPDGGSLWVVRVGTTFVWADSFEALADAGAYALDARREAIDDLAATLYPPAFARARGVDLAHGHEPLKQHLLAEYDAGYRARGRAASPPAERASLEATLDLVLRPLPDTGSVELALGLAEARGARALLRANPRAGSAFARQLAAPAPAAWPPALAGGHGLVSLAAVGPSPTLLRFYQDLLDAQARAGVAGAAGVAARLRVLAAHLDGSLATATRAAGPDGTLVYDAVLGLAPNAPAAAALEALLALAGDPGLPPLLRDLYGAGAPALKLTREGGDGARLEISFAGGQRPGTPAALARALLGAQGRTFILTALPAAGGAPGRLVIASEPGASARLAQLRGGAASVPGAALQTALDESGRADGVVFIDGWPLVRPLVAGMVSEGEARLIQGLLAMPGLAQMTLPVWGSQRGGDNLAIELRVPVVTLANVATGLALLGQGPGARAPGP